MSLLVLQSLVNLECLSFCPLIISLVADSFNSMDHQRMCTETKELEFRSLTILTFLQTSLVQSMAVSHKDITPVSQYDGLQVSVEYVEGKDRQEMFFVPTWLTLDL